MKNRAIAKIQDQIEKTDDPMMKMLGRQIIDNITSDAMAILVLAEDKTLEGCKKLFDEYAKSHKVGNRAVIGPEQAQELIFDYFGINVNEVATIKKVQNQPINILDYI